MLEENPLENSLKTRLQNTMTAAILGRLTSVIAAQCQTAAERGQDKFTFLVQDLDSFIAMLGETSQTRFRGLRASRGGTLSPTDYDDLLKPILGILASSSGLKITALSSDFAAKQHSALMAFILDWSF